MPPSRPDRPVSSARLWGALVGAALLLYLVVRLGERTPAPVGADAPPTRFSADRAWPVVTQLADSIGDRVVGSPGAARAAAYLLARWRAIPGLEVELQDVVAVSDRLGSVRASRVQNVVARLRGAVPEAVLVSVHYDSPPESVGAADDALAVAAALEAARALAAGPRLHHTVVFNVNGSEELGLLGAEGFLQHPWMRDVRAAVDLEAAGLAGRPTLFQAGPGHAWLVRAYARAVPHPAGSVLGQDIYESGGIPSNTDLTVYQGEGVPGLDIALYRNGWGYHTRLDRPAHLDRGSLQMMGDNVLALLRELAGSPFPRRVSPAAPVYYDVAGRVMIAYDATTARRLSLLATLLAAVAIGLVLLRLRVPWHALAGGLAVALGGATMALVLGVGASVLPYLAFMRPHGWYAQPWRAVLASGGFALAGLLLAHWLYARRAAPGRPFAAHHLPALWGGALLVLLSLLAATTHYRLASGYVLLWWVLPAAAALAALAITRGRWWPLAAIAGMLPGALVTMQMGEAMVALFAPIGGRFPLPVPFDVVIGALVAASTMLLAILPLAVAHRAGRLGTATLAAVAAGSAGVALLATGFPYAPHRPQRLVLSHVGDAAGTRLELESLEFVPPLVRPDTVSGASVRRAESGRVELHFPAGPTGFAPPAIRWLGERRTPGGDRTLELRVPRSDAFETVLAIPVDRWLGGTLGAAPLPADAYAHGAHVRLRLFAAPDTGWRLTLRVRGAGPLPVEATAVRAASTTDARALLARLPTWVNVFALAVDRAELAF